MASGRQRRKDWHSVRKGACVWIFRRREGGWAQERLEEILAFRRERDPDFGKKGITTIVHVIVSPDNPNYELLLLKMAAKLYRFQPHAQIKLEPWLVQRAPDRLGDRRLNIEQQMTVVAATRTPGKVRWPDGWGT